MLWASAAGTFMDSSTDVSSIIGNPFDDWV